MAFTKPFISRYLKEIPECQYSFYCNRGNTARITERRTQEGACHQTECGNWLCLKLLHLESKNVSVSKIKRLSKNVKN